MAQVDATQDQMPASRLEAADVYLHQDGRAQRARQLEAERITSLAEWPQDNWPTEGRVIRPAANRSAEPPKESAPPPPPPSDQLNSSNVILLLLVGYILWQCLFKGRKRRAKWRARLAAWADWFHLEGSEQTRRSDLGEQAILEQQFEMNSRAGAEVESLRQGGTSRLVALRRVVAKNSVVLAAGRAAGPRVRLLSSRFHHLVGGHEEEPASVVAKIRSYLSSWRANDEDRPPTGDLESGCQAAESCELADTLARSSPTIAALVHCDQAVRSDSLIALASNSTKNQIGDTHEDQKAQDKAAAEEEQQDQPRGSRAASLHSSNSRLSSSACLSSASTSNNQLAAAKLEPSGAGLLAACPLPTRCKSQSASPNQPAGQLEGAAKSASPAVGRPCCSASPTQRAAGDQTQRAAAVAFPPVSLGCSFASVSPAGRQSSVASERLRHQYENYYDDEREEAYRRLTASIGLQFGLALESDQRGRPAPSLAVGRSCDTRPPPACRCCASAALQPSSAAASLAGSDSGTCSLAASRPAELEAAVWPNLGCPECRPAHLRPNMGVLAGPNAGQLQWTPNEPQSHQLAELEVHQQQAQIGAGSLAPRWNQRRRSTMSTCARSPRRLSLAGVASWQAGASQLHGCPHVAGQTHLLHRASIASEGHQRRAYLEQLQAANSSRVASDGGSQFGGSSSSSGLGFSGSQCTNTPTTCLFPFGSLTASKADGLAEQLARKSSPLHPCCPVNFNHLNRYEIDNTTRLHPGQQQQQLQSLTDQQLQTSGIPLAPLMCQGAIRSTKAATSRKFSLPVQLESNAAEMVERKRSPNLLFSLPGADCEPTEVEELALNSTAGEEVGRRSSQTIARQSSFWLEDTAEQPTGNSQRPPTASPGSRPNSSASSGPSTRQKASAAAAPPTFRPLSSSSSSAGSSPSPSPDFFGTRQRASSRALGLGPNMASISKRRKLGRLRSRRPARQLAGSRRSKRAAEDNGAGCSKSPQANSTDEERAEPASSGTTATRLAGRSTEQEDSLGSSLDRDFLTAPPVERAVHAASSTSLERQCRDLWKLRSTLHNDASLGDDWANYHQRLNRRYDSGYKSIENQFNSSLEGNAAAPVASQTNLASGREAELFARPQSGCSSFLCDNQSAGLVGRRRSPTPRPRDEETRALLVANCDERAEDASPIGDTNPTDS